LAKDIKVQIGGNVARAEKALKELQRTGREVSSILERDFQQLGVKSSASFDAQRRAAQDAFNKIKTSGAASSNEIARAQKALADKMVALDRQQFGERTTMLEKFKKHWLAFAAGAVVLGKVARDTVDATKEFQRLGASLETVMGSSDAAAVQFERLQKFASETPYQLEEVVGGFVKMQALGLDPTEESMRSFGNTAAAMGKSFDQFVEAVADASTGEFERLKEFGIKSRQAGDQVSFTFQGITTTVGKSAAEITEYLQQIGENQFAGAMEKQMQTLGGVLSNFEDSTRTLYATLGDQLTPAIALLLGEVTELTGAGDELGNAFDGVEAVFETLVGAAMSIKFAFDQVGTGIGAVAAALVLVAEGEFQAARAALSEFSSDVGADFDELTDKIVKLRETQGNPGSVLSRNHTGSAGAAPAAIAAPKAPGANDKDKKLKEIADSLAKLRDALRSETQVIEDEYAERLQIINDARKASQLTAEEAADMEIQIAKEREQKLTELKQQGDAQRIQSTLATINVIGSASAQLLGTLASTQDQESKKGFKRYKDFAKAQAGISTALSILNAMSTVTPWYAALAASIVAGAMGAVQIAKIDSMQYQGSRAVGGSIVRGNRMLVGENGPEVVEFDTGGNVIPNDALGGGGANQINSVTTVIQISPGLTQAVQAEMMRALPAIQRSTQAAVESGLRRGR